MRSLSCFVIIPSNREEGGPVPAIEDERYGLTERPSGCQNKEEPVVIDFEEVYKWIIVPAIEKVNSIHNDVHIECRRGQDIKQPGDIIFQLIEEICKADITITDVTTQNPNVFLELGIRLSVRDSLNILIRDERAKLPFDIKSLRCISYSTSSLGKAKQAIIDITDGIDGYLERIQSGKSEEIGSLYHQYYQSIEIYTGRLAQRERLGVLDKAPTVVASLAGIALTNKASIGVKKKTYDFFNEVGAMLEKDPAGQSKAIDHYKLFANIDGLSREQLELTYDKLAELCDADDNRKAEAEHYRQELRKLEETPL